MTVKELSQFIRQRRKQLGMTIGELADATGISASTIGEFENFTRRKKAGLHIIVPLLGALGYQLEVYPSWKKPEWIDREKQRWDRLHELESYKREFEEMLAVVLDANDTELADFMRKYINILQGEIQELK